MRFCWLLEQERDLDRVRPSTWTDRCPADALARTPAVLGGLGHLEWNRAR